MRIRNVLCAVLAGFLISVGTGYAVHAHDARTAEQGTVSTFNDGFETGACAASPTVAHDTYNFTCEEWN